MALSTLWWSSVAADRCRQAAAVARKLRRSTGKAAWILVTTGLVLVLPLALQMQREEMSSMNEDYYDAQRMALLGL